MALTELHCIYFSISCSSILSEDEKVVEIAYFKVTSISWLYFPNFSLKFLLNKLIEKSTHILRASFLMKP